MLGWSPLTEFEAGICAILNGQLDLDEDEPSGHIPVGGMASAVGANVANRALNARAGRSIVTSGDNVVKFQKTGTVYIGPKTASTNGGGFFSQAVGVALRNSRGVG